MSAEALVRELNALGVFPFLEGGKLKAKASAREIPADVVAKMRSNKEALIEFLTGANTARPRAVAAIPADGRSSGRYPLSFSQRRLWFIDQLEGGGSQYNMPTALRLIGKADIAAIEWALGEIVRRHTVLRSTYAEDRGEPVQIVHDVREFRLQRIDLSALPPGLREEALRNACRDEFDRPFDLSSDPMLRACAIRLEDERHVLIINLHHIACDGWSKGVLTRELVALYAARIEGRDAALPALPIQYSDYAQWQAGADFAARVEGQCAYWQRQLADIPKVHGLRLDNPRPAQQQFAGQVHMQTLDADLMARLNAVAMAHQTTLFMVLQTAFALLLGRWSQERTVVVGTPTAGRLRQELEPMVGFFINTLVLKTVLDDGLSFAELLARGRATALDAYANQDVPFEMLVERLKPERSLSHAPLFQILFALQNNDYGVLELPGLSIEGVATESMINRFDLEVLAGELDGGFAIGWNYVTSLFEGATIAAMAESFEVLLDAITRDVGCDIHLLPMITRRDLARIERWRNDPVRIDLPESAGVHAAFQRAAAASPGDTGLIHGLFQAQAALTPDNIALVYGEERVSYAELNRRSNRVAHRLMALGVKPDERVAICAERSVEMVVGLLGILKAGGAYVPLDPAYPADRLTYMLADSAPIALLTQAKLMDSLGAWLTDASTVPVVMLDGAEGNAQLAMQPGHDPDARSQGLTPEHLAYVIYTSGSTGQPKGVMNAHGAVVSPMLWAQARFGLRPEDRFLQKTSFSFDVSVWEFFLPLQVGAQLVLARPEGHQDPQYLAELVESAGITVIHFVPSMMQIFIEMADAAKCAKIRYVLCSGEALSASLQHRLHDFLPHAELHNLYGPTEAAVHVTHWHCTPQDHLVTIGHPIANTTIHVLDPHLNPVPLGVPGELYIGGDQVARGYLNRQALTAERFVADPFAADPRARMYRTGDLGRLRRDGTIEYLGRNDFQVKIRGFRIELGEIEACLHACLGVRDAVVLAREDKAGDVRLVAYVVALEGVDLSVPALREQLSNVLAEHMLPSVYLVLPGLPITPNGKLDRQALPAPDANTLASRDYEAPVGEVESVVARIWQELLGVERVGRRDHFFELGGHSLLVMRMANRIHQHLGIKAAVRTVFAHPTLESLCGALSLLQRGVFEPMAVADRSRPLPLSYSQQRLWYIHRLEGGSAQYHLPTALRLHGAVDFEALQASFDRIVERHEILRTVYDTIDGSPVQRVLPVRQVELTCSDFGDALASASTSASTPDETLIDLLRAEALRPFDLARDLMLRAHVITVGPHEHVLLCTIHHIASDGWSMGVLTNEFAALYGEFAHGRPGSLPPMTVQYGDFAVWQRAPAQVWKLDEQLAYWTAHLAGLPPVHSLPLDRPRPHEMRYDGGSHRQILPAPLTKAAKEFARDCDATLFMLLQGALSVVLMRWGNAGEIVIGSPVAGRSRGELDASIGLYINTLVFRHARVAGSTFRDAVVRSRHLALEAYAHQDVPFEMLVERLRPARSLNSSPLFQVMFVLQNNEQTGFELEGVRIEGIELASAQTKFDLSLSIREVDDRLLLQWSYASSIFDAATIARIAESFEIFLRGALSAPDDDLRNVAFTPPADLERYRRWNETRTGYPDTACIHELVSATVRRMPDAIAVRDDRRALTYAQLETASDAVAKMLAASGIGAGARVAVCMDPSVELITAFLGVMKCGASYIPLDLKNPPARMLRILEDAAVDMVLGIRGLADPLAEASARVLTLADCLDPDWQRQWRAHALPVKVPADASVYVIYTSGSTGTPKGVDVPHRGLTEYCTFAGRHYYEPQLSGSLVVTSHGFDITVPSLYVPLLEGGCVDLMPQDGILHRVAALLAAPDCASYLLRMTPMHVHALCAILPRGLASRARHVFVIGGEQFLPADALALQALFPDSRLYNHYGPSETVVGCCMYDISSDIDRLGETLPIGKAMSNTCLFVLDDAMRQVPIGVAGELYIGGDCVSKGYVNRPALTLERFPDNPFGPAWAPRLYRTGDLVHFDAHGRLVFRGRVDEQIKLRGFRIEPAEIEAQIAAVDGVGKALVMATGEGEHQSLVAYLVPQRRCDDEEAAALVARVRRALRAALPEYLNPSAYLCIDRFPLSANGKLDRKALPAVQFAPDAEMSAPADAIEAGLRDVWASVFRVDADGISTTAGFFDIGGHSLLAITLIEAINRRFGVAIPLSSLYTAPTIRDQALLMSSDDGQPASQVVQLQRGSGAPPLFLIHPVGGDVLCYRQLVSGLALDCAVYGIQHEAFATTEAVSLKSVEQLAAEYCAHIRQRQPQGPYRLAGWSLGGVIALAIAHRLEDEGETVAYLGMLDSVLDHDEEPWRSLQARVDRPEALSSYLALLRDEPGATARFDAAYRLDALSGDAEAMRDRLRAVIVAGTIAARRFGTERDVRRLHYYSASRTAERLASAAVERVLAMSREPARARTFDADHFSLMQAPAVDLLARRMRSDLLETDA